MPTGIQCEQDIMNAQGNTLIHFSTTMLPEIRIYDFSACNNPVIPDNSQATGSKTPENQVA